MPTTSFVVEEDGPAEIDPGLGGALPEIVPVALRQHRHERGIDGQLLRLLEQRLDLDAGAPAETWRQKRTSMYRGLCSSSG